MSAPVDVLAVLDAAINTRVVLKRLKAGEHGATEGGHYMVREVVAESLPMHEARAAVAEMIEALEKIERRAKAHPDDDDADRKRNLYHCEAIARTALARIGGAS